MSPDRLSLVSTNLSGSSGHLSVEVSLPARGSSGSSTNCFRVSSSGRRPRDNAAYTGQPDLRHQWQRCRALSNMICTETHSRILHEHCGHEQYTSLHSQSLCQMEWFQNTPARSECPSRSPSVPHWSLPLAPRPWNAHAGVRCCSDLACSEKIQEHGCHLPT